MKNSTLKRWSILSCYLLITAVSAQEMVAERIADLMPANYSIAGQAFLRAFDDGSTLLVLSDDFDTPAGPDVRILLGPTMELDSATEIINLSTINHFSGGLEVPLQNIGIDDFDIILFYCVSFNQLWASGDFGDPADGSGGGEEYVCSENATATTNWVTLVDICPGDGIADSLELKNNIGEAVGEHYAYLLTDTNEVLLEVVLDSFYNFEESGSAPLRVYGINYDGELNPVIGANRMQTTAMGCYVHSSADLFLTVTKNSCIVPFECQESLTATFAWVTNVDNCSTDGEADEILIQNNIMTLPGEHYVFLLTDTNEVLLEMIMDSVYNFEGRGTEDLRVYGLSYDGELSPAIGENRMNTTASNCYIHSGGNLFLTVHQTAACPTSLFDPVLSAEVVTYPNPTVDGVTISWPTYFSPDQLQLVDPLGRVVKRFQVFPNVSTFRLDLAGVERGTYQVRMQSQRKMATKTIQVLR